MRSEQPGADRARVVRQTADALKGIEQGACEKLLQGPKIVDGHVVMVAGG